MNARIPHPASTNSTYMLTTDQVLGKGRYRIIGNFTQDETGCLYEAYDTVSNSNVVLRETVGRTGGVMTPAQLDEINTAFEGEAKVLTEARHEGLLSVQDYFSEIDRHYLVMEPVDGCDLMKFLSPDEKMPSMGDVMKWADQILGAVDYLHSLNSPCIHRDIRPANIRLTSNFKIKLLTAGISTSDFIMAAASDPSDASVLNYRPLEQLWGGLDPASQKVITNSYDDRSRKILQQPLDARSDIYSVGATLYHLITRTLPKDALERSIDILDGNSDPLVPPAELDPSVPEEISEVIMKAMELRREHRYDSAAIMRQVLDSTWKRVQQRKSADTKPRSVPEPLPPAEPTETVVDLNKAAAGQLEAPPPHVELKEEEATKEAARAEERRREIEADLEVQRKEAERLRAADTFEKPDEPPLLEVEAVRTVDEIFEWSVDVSEQPSRKETAARSEEQPFSDLDFNIETAPSSNFKFVAAGAGGLVVLVAIIGWFFIGGSTPAETPKAQSPVVQQPAQQDQIPVSTYTEPASSNSAIATEPTPQINESVTVESRPESKAAVKDKKPTPTPAKSTEKKKVTVDDLINDN